MPLDLFIHGPGFGECIICRWTESPQASHPTPPSPLSPALPAPSPQPGPPPPGESGPETKFALIDGFGRDGSWLRARFDELGIDRFEFVAVTHPHLDHVQGVAQALGSLGWDRVKNLWWWGGVEPQVWTSYFERIAKRQNEKSLSYLATSLRDLFDHSSRSFEQNNRPVISAVARLSRIHPREGASRLTAQTISPWTDSLIPYFQQINLFANVEAHDHAYRHRDANLVSLGLILQYAGCQVVLGGDMEEDNWKSLRACPTCPPLCPSLIKVSNHGSSSGEIHGMWSDAGFFGRRDGAAYAVVTPSKTGSHPDPEVIRRIQNAGFDVWVTGQRPKRNRFSHVHARINDEGTCQIIDAPGSQLHPASR